MQQNIKNKIGITMASSVEQIEKLWPEMFKQALVLVGSKVNFDKETEKLSNLPFLRDLLNTWANKELSERKSSIDELSEWLISKAYQTRQYCIRCGSCCKSSGPALTIADANLILTNKLLRENVCAIRAGEPVRDERKGEIRAINTERIKIRENNTVCCFYSDKTGCGIYENRPLQCRNLECWNTADDSTLPTESMLNRKDIYKDNPIVLDFIQAHEIRCPADAIIELAKKAESSAQSKKELIDFIGFDLHVREVALERKVITPEETDLVFGRPASMILAPIGWKFEF